MTDKVELSLNSVIGLTTPGTMKLRVTVCLHEVTMLVNCGACDPQRSRFGIGTEMVTSNHGNN